MKNRLFKGYKRNDYKPADKVRLDIIRKECQKAVGTARLTYVTNNMGNRLNNPNSDQKIYWKIINKYKVPPLLINNMFILNCKEKAKLFIDFFSQNVNLLLVTVFCPILIT